MPETKSILVKRYTRNAAAHILQMLADGRVDVGPRTVRVKRLDDARTIKLGKLRRHLGIMNHAAANPRGAKHLAAVAVWTAVQDRIGRASSLRAVKALAK